MEVVGEGSRCAGTADRTGEVETWLKVRRRVKMRGGKGAEGKGGEERGGRQCNGVSQCASYDIALPGGGSWP